MSGCCRSWAVPLFDPELLKCTMPTETRFEQVDLFGQPVPRQEETLQAPLQALRVTAAHTGRKLSPAQQALTSCSRASTT